MIIRHPKIRIASVADAPAIQELLKNNGLWVGGLDWSELEGWFVAEHKGLVIGAFQVLPGKPLGVFLYLVLSLEYHASGAGYHLFKAAEAALLAMGCDGWLGLTSDDNVLDMSRRLGATETGTFRIMIKRIWRNRENHTQKDLH